MGSDRAALARVSGLRFVRLLGTGRGSDLSLGADLRRWARFAVWEDEAAFHAFEATEWRARERRGASETCTLLLRPLRWRGTWSGRNPFGTPPFADAHDGPLAVLTRGTIKPRLARAFWASVPSSQAGLHDQPGLVASLGVGEAPLLYQATFSVWRDAASVRDFAYKQGGHREAITRTRELGWYAEEMFARFAVSDVVGTLNGRDLAFLCYNSGPGRNAVAREQREESPGTTGQDAS